MPDPKIEAETLGWEYTKIEPPPLPGFVDYKIRAKEISVRSLMARTLRGLVSEKECFTREEALACADAIESPSAENRKEPV